jgi:Ca2+-binding RTX toxin-like protein
VVSHTFDAEGVAPTATVSLSQNSLIVGQTATVTVTTNEPVNPAFTVVADHATVGAFTQTGADTYQATLTPNAGETSAHNLVTVSNLADLVGNTAAGTFTSGDYAVDTLAPSVVSQTVTGATVHASQTAQLVTTFSEAVANFGAANQSTDHGTLGTPTTSDGGVTWTTVFTPDAGAHAAAHTALVLTGLTDLAGNPIGGAGEAYPTIQEQTVLPSATISLDQTSLHPGDTMGVTVAFNQAVTGFDNTDLGLQGGTLSPVQTSDGGTTWHATFTAGNTLGASDHISLNLAGVTDADGNAGVGSDLSPGFDVIAAASPPPPPPPPTPDPTPSQPTDSGPETMTGSQGADTLSGGTDSDMVSGGGGDDSMSGQAGADTLAGGDGGDFLQGNVGTDSVNGGAGDDKVYGGQGDDQVQGGPGADFVSGDKGDDVVRGGQGDDVVSGGDGNDFISGDLGSDTMTGGAGADTFHSFAGAGLDVVTDFNLAEGDRVELDPGTTFTSAQVGADTVITLSGPGGAGELVLQGVQLSSLHGDWIFVG